MTDSKNTDSVGSIQSVSRALKIRSARKKAQIADGETELMRNEAVIYGIDTIISNVVNSQEDNVCTRTRITKNLTLKPAHEECDLDRLIASINVLRRIIDVIEKAERLESDGSTDIKSCPISNLQLSTDESCRSCIIPIENLSLEIWNELQSSGTMKPEIVTDRNGNVFIIWKHIPSNPNSPSRSQPYSPMYSPTSESSSDSFDPKKQNPCKYTKNKRTRKLSGSSHESDLAQPKCTRRTRSSKLLKSSSSELSEVSDEEFFPGSNTIKKKSYRTRRKTHQQKDDKLRRKFKVSLPTVRLVRADNFPVAKLRALGLKAVHMESQHDSDVEFDNFEMKEEVWQSDFPTSDEQSEDEFYDNLINSADTNNNYDPSDGNDSENTLPFNDCDSDMECSKDDVAQVRKNCDLPIASNVSSQETKLPSNTGPNSGVDVAESPTCFAEQLQSFPIKVVENASFSESNDLKTGLPITNISSASEISGISVQEHDLLEQPQSMIDMLNGPLSPTTDAVLTMNLLPFQRQSDLSDAAPGSEESTTLSANSFSKAKSPTATHTVQRATTVSRATNDNLNSVTGLGVEIKLATTSALNTSSVPPPTTIVNQNFNCTQLPTRIVHPAITVTRPAHPTFTPQIPSHILENIRRLPPNHPDHIRFKNILAGTSSTLPRGATSQWPQCRVNINGRLQSSQPSTTCDIVSAKTQNVPNEAVHSAVQPKTLNDRTQNRLNSSTCTSAPGFVPRHTLSVASKGYDNIVSSIQRPNYSENNMQVSNGNIYSSPFSQNLRPSGMPNWQPPQALSSPLRNQASAVQPTWMGASMQNPEVSNKYPFEPAQQARFIGPSGDTQVMRSSLQPSLALPGLPPAFQSHITATPTLPVNSVRMRMHSNLEQRNVGPPGFMPGHIRVTSTQQSPTPSRLPFEAVGMRQRGRPPLSSYVQPSTRGRPRLAAQHTTSGRGRPRLVQQRNPVPRPRGRGRGRGRGAVIDMRSPMPVQPSLMLPCHLPVAISSSPIRQAQQSVKQERTTFSQCMRGGAAVNQHEVTSSHMNFFHPPVPRGITPQLPIRQLRAQYPPDQTRSVIVQNRQPVQMMRAVTPVKREQAAAPCIFANSDQRPVTNIVASNQYHLMQNSNMVSQHSQGDSAFPLQGIRTHAPQNYQTPGPQCIQTLPQSVPVESCSSSSVPTQQVHGSGKCMYSVGASSSKVMQPSTLPQASIEQNVIFSSALMNSQEREQTSTSNSISQDYECMLCGSLFENEEKLYEHAASLSCMRQDV